MAVRLCDFAKKFIEERGLIRKDKGPSIVPLMVVNFTRWSMPTRSNRFSRPLLLTVCQRTGNVFHTLNLEKRYSMGAFLDPTYGWWVGADIVSIVYRKSISSSRILQITAQVNRHVDYD